MAGLLTAAEIADITAMVASSLDVALPVYRKATSTDSYGHSTEDWTNLVGTFNVNIFSPSAKQLQAYAGIIGSQNALMLRFLPASDIREGDRVIYMAKNWIVQNIQNAESYTFAYDALVTNVS
jgi:Tfp pilus assembly major pilin PilA